MRAETSTLPLSPPPFPSLRDTIFGDGVQQSLPKIQLFEVFLECLLPQGQFVPLTDVTNE